MWWYQYRCDRCGRQEDVTTSILARYRLDDGREIPGFDQPVWCYVCNGLRTAERLADTELESFSHPSCGGRFECRKEGHAMQMHARIMNLEGFEIIAEPGATPAE